MFLSPFRALATSRQPSLIDAIVYNFPRFPAHRSHMPLKFRVAASCGQLHAYRYITQVGHEFKRPHFRSLDRSFSKKIYVDYQTRSCLDSRFRPCRLQCCCLCGTRQPETGIDHWRRTRRSVDDDHRCRELARRSDGRARSGIDAAPVATRRALQYRNHFRLCAHREAG